MEAIGPDPPLLQGQESCCQSEQAGLRKTDKARQVAALWVHFCLCAAKAVGLWTSRFWVQGSWEFLLELCAPEDGARPLPPALLLLGSGDF